jgi:hypothetical protein
LLHDSLSNHSGSEKGRSRKPKRVGEREKSKEMITLSIIILIGKKCNPDSKAGKLNSNFEAMLSKLKGHKMLKGSFISTEDEFWVNCSESPAAINIIK